MFCDIYGNFPAEIPEENSRFSGGNSGGNPPIYILRV